MIDLLAIQNPKKLNNILERLNVDIIIQVIPIKKFVLRIINH